MREADKQEIASQFEDYIRMYTTRDDLLTERFSEDFSGYTGGGDFLVKDREQWVAITRQDFAQVRAAIRVEHKDMKIQVLSEDVAVVTAFFVIHLPIKDHILSRETARLVLVYKKEATGWMIAHSGISIPYHLVRAGEVYPLRELVEHNRALEEQVHERTAELEARNLELLQALSQVRTLKGLLPICASCKQIRDNEGHWHQMEQYIHDRTDAEFSHGLCPECADAFRIDADEAMQNTTKPRTNR